MSKLMADHLGQLKDWILKWILSNHENRIKQLEERMAAIDDVIKEISDATDAIAAQIEALISRINNGDTAAVAQLQPLADRLKVLGQDPNNPVPTP